MKIKPVIGESAGDKAHITQKATIYMGKSIQEQFKGEVNDVKVKFPKELGVEHPFDFEEAQKINSGMGLVNGMIDKWVDTIVGQFSVSAEVPNIDVSVKSFVKNTNFPIELRAWIKEGFMKGNGFMELDLEEMKARTINANGMYVQRDKKKNVTGYNQFLGNSKRMTINKSNVVEFKPNQIAHLKINDDADAAYGLGFIWPSVKALENFVQNEYDVHRLMTRKAGAPYHVKLGQPGEIVQQGDIDDFKTRLEYQNTRTEWVTDGSVEITAIDFGKLGESLTSLIKQDLLMIYAGFQIPEVLVGSGQLNEGIAKVQLEGIQRKAASIQEKIESILEEKVFKPLLLAQNLDGEVMFTWNLPGEDEKNKRIEQMQMLISSPLSSTNIKRYAELEIAKILEFKNAENILPKPEKGLEEKEKQEQIEQEDRDAERKAEGKLKQPESPGAKPNAREHHLTESDIQDMTIQEWVNLKELDGFNFGDYLLAILKSLKKDPFKDLKAITEQDLADGLLSKEQITKLRIVLGNGFKKNQTMDQIEKEVKELNLPDRKHGETLVLAAAARAPNIARTETVRLANEGLVKTYKEHKVERVRWLAAMSDRTCPQCEPLNGQVFNINELKQGVSQPPLHPMCRCSLVGIIE